MELERGTEKREAMNTEISRRSLLRTSALVGVGFGAVQLLGSSPAEALGGTTNSALDKSIRAMVKGRTIKVGFTPPVLSENFTQIEHAAWQKMYEFERRFGVKFSESTGGVNPTLIVRPLTFARIDLSNAELVVPPNASAGEDPSS